MIKYISLSAILMLLINFSTKAQATKKADSTKKGLINTDNTVISGYGEAHYKYDMRTQTANVNLTRATLYFNHRFNENISLHSEFEIESAKVEGGESGGEVSFETLYLRFQISKLAYLKAGLFVLRSGIINEYHLPNTFNSVDRPYLETLLIPSTWRDLGVGLYGQIKGISGLSYSLAMVNGLNSADFENGTGIKEGVFEGKNATATNIAIAASLRYNINNLRLQASAYYGGTAGLSKRQADSLQLDYGAFGTPVFLPEFDIMYNNNGFGFRAIGAMAQIPDAEKINRAYANNTPQMMVGGYAELSYNLLRFFNKKTKRQLNIFGRYEYMDLNYKIPKNGIYNGTLNKSYFVMGLNYHPINQVVIKVDYELRTTGDRNPALVVTPYPQQVPYYTSNGFLNIGVGYSF